MIPTASIPQSPGVYIFKDKHNTIIYIGKAKNLRFRVSSYFKESLVHSIKTQFLVKNIHDAQYVLVDNEVEALLLENRLIKEHSPKYNINLKDAKTYAYIALSEGPFPKIYSTRKVTKKCHYFGPYTDGSARRQIVELAIELFQLRVCKTLPKRACLNYHIGLCTAPCIKNVSEQQYNQQVQKAIDFLKGHTKPVLKQLEIDMNTASQNLLYEKALQKKRQIEAIMHLQEKQQVDKIRQFDQDVLALIQDQNRAVIAIISITKGVILNKKEYSFEYDQDLFCDFIKMYYSQHSIPQEIIVNTTFWQEAQEQEILEAYLTRLRGAKVSITMPQRGDKVDLIHLAEKNAKFSLGNVVLEELKEKLILPSLPRTIECFDISNLGYDYIVGAMTQWILAKPNKAGYRRFEIKTVGGKNDDFASMHEVIKRRYTRVAQGEESQPDLIIVDGGKGQLHAALAALKETGLQIPIIALAKREEEIYIPGRDEPLQFDKNIPLMLLLRAIRDSVHNFVLSYNRKKRQMRLREEMKK